MTSTEQEFKPEFIFKFDGVFDSNYHEFLKYEGLEQCVRAQHNELTEKLKHIGEQITGITAIGSAFFHNQVPYFVIVNS